MPLSSVGEVGDDRIARLFYFINVEFNKQLPLLDFIALPDVSFEIVALDFNFIHADSVTCRKERSNFSISGSNDFAFQRAFKNRIADSFCVTLKAISLAATTLEASRRRFEQRACRI